MRFAGGARIGELISRIRLEEREHRSDAAGAEASLEGEAFSFGAEEMRVTLSFREIEKDCMLIHPEIENRAKGARRIVDVAPLEYAGDWNARDIFAVSDRAVVHTWPAERNYGYDGAQSVDRCRPLLSCWFVSIHDPADASNLLIGIAGVPESFARIRIMPLIADREKMRVLQWECICDCRSGSRGVRLEPGARFHPGDLCVMRWSGDHAAGLRRYAELLASRTGARRIHPAPAGWCSWYAGYEWNIDEAECLANLSVARTIPGMRLFQIDDGWMADSAEEPLRPIPHPEKFPRGMKLLAARIAEAGLQPGIWIRPFRGSGERMATPRWARGPCIDLSDPEALRRLEEYARTLAAEWGFRYIKFDFAAHDMFGGWGMHLLEPADARFEPIDDRATNIRMFRDGLEALRRGAGEETFLLGCNCLLGPAIGIVDGMRIGDDVSAAHWDRTVTMGARSIPHMQFLNGILWWNDPDCLLFHEPLAIPRARLWNVAAALAGGARIASSKLHMLSAERLELLRAVMAMSIGEAEIVQLDSGGLPEILLASGEISGASSRLLGFLNWSDEPRRIPLPAGVRRLFDHSADPAWKVYIGAAETFAQPPDEFSPLIPASDCLLIYREDRP